MIRLLTAADRQQLLALANQAPAFNLFMLGNLEKLGIQHELSQFWGDFAEDATAVAPLRAVVNRYMTGWTVYGALEADWAGLAAVLDNHPIQAARLQDNPGGTPSLLPFIKRYRPASVVVEELMELAPAAFAPVAPRPEVTVRRATMADLNALVAFYGHAEEMTRTGAAVARPLQDTRIWVVEKGREIVAAALTNAETQTMAMIGGVYTKPTARGQGFSQIVCSALCADLIAAGLRPVLYGGRPAAGVVYRKLGFHAIGKWRAVWLEKIE